MMNETDQSQDNIFAHPTIDSQDFTKDDYMHLWEYFSDRADMLKDRLWTMATWLLGFNSAILGFIFGTPLIAFDSAGSTIRAPAFVLALALAGCVLCLYAFFLIYDYGKHIQRNWDRAGVLKEKFPLVKEALAGKPSTEDEREEALAGKPSTEAESENALVDNTNTKTAPEDGKRSGQRKTARKAGYHRLRSISMALP